MEKEKKSAPVPSHAKNDSNAPSAIPSTVFQVDKNKPVLGRNFPSIILTTSMRIWT